MTATDPRPGLPRTPIRGLAAMPAAAPFPPRARREPAPASGGGEKRRPPRVREGGQRVDSFMPETDTAYEPCA